MCYMWGDKIDSIGFLCVYVCPYDERGCITRNEKWKITMTLEKKINI